VVALACRLRRKRPKGGQRSLRDVAAELAQRGHLNEQGRPFSAASVRSMLVRPHFWRSNAVLGSVWEAPR
jgi:hypothetical protein